MQQPSLNERERQFKASALELSLPLDFSVKWLFHGLRVSFPLAGFWLTDYIPA